MKLIHIIVYLSFIQYLEVQCEYILEGTIVAYLEFSIGISYSCCH
jgi:hypothetical protein